MNISLCYFFSFFCFRIQILHVHSKHCCRCCDCGGTQRSAMVQQERLDNRQAYRPLDEDPWRGEGNILWCTNINIKEVSNERSCPTLLYPHRVGPLNFIAKWFLHLEPLFFLSFNHNYHLCTGIDFGCFDQPFNFKDSTFSLLK